MPTGIYDRSTAKKRKRKTAARAPRQNGTSVWVSTSSQTILETMKTNHGWTYQFTTDNAIRNFMSGLAKVEQPPVSAVQQHVAEVAKKLGITSDALIGAAVKQYMDLITNATATISRMQQQK